MCFPSKDNRSFPASAARFMDNLQKGDADFVLDDKELLGDEQEGESVIKIPLSNKNFKSLVASNPVAAAFEFKRMLRAVYKELFGIEMESSDRKRSECLSSRPVGMI